MLLAFPAQQPSASGLPMTYKYSCFISYRNPHHEVGIQFRDGIMNALSGEMDLLSDLPVFLDEGRLQGGDFFNAELARALCQSVCMVLIYTPHYFSLTKTYCAREYKGMCDLEARRFEAAKIDNPGKGLIIPIALRAPDGIPDELKLKRYVEDFTDLLLYKKNISEDPIYSQKIKLIAEYIFHRCKDLKEAPSVFDDCESFKFPPDNEIRKWLESVVNPPQGFPK